LKGLKIEGIHRVLKARGIIPEKEANNHVTGGGKSAAY
jgi:hypothetical protein